jgi:putative ABC transport system permease protein
MLKNYLRVALRNLETYKAYSLINIAGLAVGLACCIIIVLYVQNQLSYDKFNENAERIYRPVFQTVMMNRVINDAASPMPMGPALLDEFPQVAAYTRLRHWGAPVLRYADKAFSEPRFLFVDSTFFDVFTADFLVGNPRTALTQPNSLVLTESMARKYFGNADPMGKILNADHESNWIVTGVIKDWPRNSHFGFDFLGSLCTLSRSRSTVWMSDECYTYFVLKKGTNPLTFQEEMNKVLMRKYIEAQLAAMIGVAAANSVSTSGNWKYTLQPLTSIHLFSHLDHEFEANGDVSYTYVFSAIAIGILLIACVNFINLATARSEKRSKEVGVRKTLGSSRRQLVRQFLTESVLMSLLAVVLAIGLVELFLPLFNSIAGESISLDLFRNVIAIPTLLTFGIAVGLVAGSYPAFYLSSFDPVQVLKGDARWKNSRAILRGSLVVFQFVVSIGLFIGTSVILSQLKYMQTRDLGFNKEQVIVIKRANDLGSKLEEFKLDLLANASVASVSASSAVPGSGQEQSVYWVEGATTNRPPCFLQWINCDYDFLKTYGMTLADGRFFSAEHPSDTGAVIVNQQSQTAFGVGNLTGKSLTFPSLTGRWTLAPIVGVVKDFSFQSLHEHVSPVVLWILRSGRLAPYLSVRIKPGNYPATISFIENTWKKYSDNEAIDYSFLDQDIEHMYIADQQTGKIVTTFAILAIFVACLGLLGLAAFVTERRTKEIGIRKVLGASMPSIIAMLSKEFAKWVLIANIVAWPVAYYVMNNWLKNFAYRTNISLWIFVSSGALALIVALLTVSSHAIKAATANPVESLRYE